VKWSFFGDGLKIDVQRFLAEGLVFQQNKVETLKTLGFFTAIIHSKSALGGGFHGFHHRAIKF
jgi:hypothetical protein